MAALTHLGFPASSGWPTHSFAYKKRKKRFAKILFTTCGRADGCAKQVPGKLKGSAQFLQPITFFSILETQTSVSENERKMRLFPSANKFARTCIPYSLYVPDIALTKFETLASPCNTPIKKKCSFSCIKK